MTLPTNQTKEHIDQGTDDPKQARAEFSGNIDKFNALLVHLAESGITNYPLTVGDGLQNVANTSLAAKVLTAGGVQAPSGGIQLNLNGLAEESAILGGDFLGYYDVSAGAHRKIQKSDLVSAAWDDITGKKITFFDFTDTSDTAITTNIPTSVLWSSSQSITIPSKGVIAFTPFLRINNGSGTARNYYVGLRIDGTDYYVHSDNDGTLAYYTITGLIPSGEYQVTKGAGGPAGDIPGALMLDIEGFGISTGSQTVQPIIASTLGGASQILKGTVVTARLGVTIFDRS